VLFCSRAQDGSARNPHRTVWRAMAHPSNVVRLTTERRERADRQRTLASAYRLEAVAHIPADVRPAVVQAVAKALKQERPDAFRRLPWPWCERLLEWWDLRIETRRKARVVVPLPTLRAASSIHRSFLRR
jgi:hypothetical protein